MARNESSRFSSITSSSTDSAKSTATVKPLPSIPTADSAGNKISYVSPSSKRAVPVRVKTTTDGSLGR
jgi:adenylate cyclase